MGNTQGTGSGGAKQGLSEKRLRYLYEAVLAGSLRSAAEKLEVEPSVLSRQIQLLEADVGVQLLERRGRGVSPTEAALIVVEHCKERFSAEEALRQKLDDLNGLHRGEVRIAAGEGFMAHLLVPILENFCARYPGINISLDLANAADAVRLVQQDQVHIGLALSPPPNEQLHTIAARRQPLCAVVWPGHPLTHETLPLTMAQALDYPHGLMAQGYGLRQLVQLAAFSDSIVLRPSFTSNSIALLKHYVMARAGITFLSHIAVATEKEAGALIALPVHNAVLEQAQARLFVRRNRPMPFAVRHVIDSIRQLGLFSGFAPESGN